MARSLLRACALALCSTLFATAAAAQTPSVGIMPPPLSPDVQTRPVSLQRVAIDLDSQSLIKASTGSCRFIEATGRAEGYVQDLSDQTLARIFNERVRAAGFDVEGNSGDLFSNGQ